MAAKTDMAETVGDVLLGRLRDWGVEQVFAFRGMGSRAVGGVGEAAVKKPQFVRAVMRRWPRSKR